MNKKPLDGIKVLDLTRLLPGPVCTLHLADMGADVIKIEDPITGDYSRAVPPLQKSTSCFFLAINRNKRSLTLNIRTEEGKKIFLKLAEKADVIVESFRPGVVQKLGIDYHTVKSVNPSIIYCAITGYGQTGPYKDKAGHDLNFTAYAGALRPDPRRGNPPSIPNYQIGDIVGGSLNAAMGILAALIQQKSTGEGQYIDVSILDGVLAHSAVALSHLKSVELFGMDTSDMLNGMLHFYALYETKDGKFMALAALEFKFWQCFCEAIGRPALANKHLAMGEESEKVFAELDSVFREKTQEQWIVHFKEVDCCVTPVLSLHDALNNPHIRARKTVLIEEHPEEGPVTQFALPMKFSGFDFVIEKPAPSLGQHTVEVLQEAGFSAAEIGSFRSGSVV